MATNTPPFLSPLREPWNPATIWSLSIYSDFKAFFQMTSSDTPAQNPISVQSMPIVVHAQYLKDVSFENPGAPLSLRPGGTPEMNVAINLEAKNIPDDKIKNLFEVTIQLRVRAMRDDKPLFLTDIDYALAVSLDQIPETQRHAVLLIEVPKLGFPFIRQILADLVSSGGFPPLMLTPVDFAAMYLERFGKKDGDATQ